MKKGILLIPILLVSILTATAVQAKTNASGSANGERFSNCVGVYINGVCYGVSWLKAHNLSLKTATPAKVRAALKKDKLKAARLKRVEKQRLAR